MIAVFGASNYVFTPMLLINLLDFDCVVNHRNSRLFAKLKSKSYRMKLKFSIAIALIPAAFLFSCQQNQSPSSQNDLSQIREITTDTALNEGMENSFAREAAIGSTMEIESSAIMIKLTENRDVQNLATIMVKDHSAAKKELTELALGNKITLPQTLPSHKLKTLDTLKALDEDKRNLFYAQLMVKEHEDAVKIFKEASLVEQHKLLNQFAKAQLPILEHHLMEAKKVLHIMEIIKKDKGDLPLKVSQDRNKN